MKTFKTKTLIYDSQCPMCSWYTGEMVEKGLIEKEGRISFEELPPEKRSMLDMNRARHEIPMIDNATGELLYGLDALTLVIGNSYKFLQLIITQNWFKALLRPLYNFISYNRRIIAGSRSEPVGAVSFAPDFSIKWRMALIGAGFAYTALSIYLFAMLMAINPLILLGCVTLYFLVLLTFDLKKNETGTHQLDYVAHLAVLGFIEGTLFIITALLAKLTGLTGLMFAGQGAGRLLAIGLHIKRVKNNHYAKSLNYVFAAGAVGLIVIIAIFKS